MLQYSPFASRVITTFTVDCNGYLVIEHDVHCGGNLVIDHDVHCNGNLINDHDVSVLKSLSDSYNGLDVLLIYFFKISTIVSYCETINKNLCGHF